MRITTRIEIELVGMDGRYAQGTFYHDNTTFKTGLLDNNECIILAERLRSAAESLEHYSRILSNNQELTSK